MRYLLILIRRDFRETRQITAFRIMLVIAAVLTATVSIAVSIALRLQPWYGANEAVFALEIIIALLIYAPSTGPFESHIRTQALRETKAQMVFGQQT